jgi:hypothetical protein
MDPLLDEQKREGMRSSVLFVIVTAFFPLGFSLLAGLAFSFSEAVGSGATVPEPSAVFLLATGLAGIGLLGRYTVSS